jgi:diacylglycerol kinase
MVLASQSDLVATEGRAPITQPGRRWKEKFADSLRGLKQGIRGHSSFSVHFFFAALVIAAAIVISCQFVEWCILLICIGMVLTAELFNSAIETICRGLDEETRDRIQPAFNIAAGAVLVASLFAIVIGAIVFFHSLLGRFLPPA